MLNIHKREITEKELSLLSSFLTAKYKDAKPMNLTQTHGFLTAITSAPHIIMPSKYQPVLLGGYPEFNSMQQAQEIMGILTVFGNQINHLIREEKPFVPFLWQDNKSVNYDIASLELIGEWCKGYLAAVSLDPIWSSSEQAISCLLPFSVLAGKFNLIGGLDNDGNTITDDTEHKKLYKEKLPLYITEFYDMWKEHRKNSVPIYGADKPKGFKEEENILSPIRRTKSKVGRNELCPCGSGNKFKKCCGSHDRVLN